MSKILKRNYVVIDDAKKYPIPISGKPREEIEREMREAAAEADDEHSTEPPQENIDKTAPAEPEPPVREYDFEDFNFAEHDDMVKAREKQREDELAAAQILEEAQSKSEEIIMQATKAAELIIKHTLDNAKAELNNAITAGYSDGFESGKNESLKIIEPAMNKINLLMETINRLQDKMLYEFRDSMFHIISEISNKIVHREISENNNYLVALFSDAIQDIKAEEFVTITVAESELTLATRNRKLFLSEIPHIKDFKIVSEKNAAKGTMIVETEKSVADASVDNQLENVNYLLERMKEKLNIPQTVDDVINQMSLRSIEDYTATNMDEDMDNDDMEMGDGYSGGYGEDAVENAASNRENHSNSGSGIGANQNSGFENLQSFDDISDEDIMKYFDSSDS